MFTLNRVVPSFILISLVLLLSFMAVAKDSVIESFDSQRPKAVSDEMWGSLKAAVQEVKLLPTPVGIGGENSRFGASLSVDGNRALVGAPNIQGHGIVYVLDFFGGVWIESAILKPSDGVDSDQFGFSVSLSGDRALIGAYLDDDNGSDSGSAYTFDLSGGSWSQTHKLTAGDGAADDQFGYSVSLSGDRALIGAIFDDDNGNNSGSAYIFDFSGGSWSQTQKTTPDDGIANDLFGNSVSLSGNRALVGAIFDDDNGNNSGSAYFFDLSGGSWSQTQKITANDSASNDRFGYSVSLSGDRALIGAYLDDDNGSNSGSAYIFDLSGGSWSQTQKLKASDAAAGDNFGNSVSLSGDKALVGAYLDDDNGRDSGSAYIFDLSGGSWSQTQKLISDDGAAYDYFGYSISLSGNRALVGANQDNDNGGNSGSAYIFDFSGGSWSQTQKLTPDDGALGNQFGNSVSLSGDRALIGASQDDDNGNFSGSAYIFDFSGGSWSQTQKITPDDGMANDWFGNSVSLSGNRALVGAIFDDDNGDSSGSAYIFDFSGGSWSQTQKLTSSDSMDFNSFGNSVSLNGDRALIGAIGDSGGSGSAYVFDFTAGVWSQTQKLTAGDGAAGDNFGNSVSISGNRALVGAYQDDDNGNSSGSAYIFDLSGGSWLPTQKLTPDDGAVFDYFGYSVSLSGDKALVGAYQDDDNGNNSGSAYVFDLLGGSWSLTQKITAVDGTDADSFGASVSLSGDRVLIGATGDDERGTNSGAAYIINIGNNNSQNIAVTVTGLDATNSIEVTSNGQSLNFTGLGGPTNFGNPILEGLAYAVQISADPTSPNQSCNLTGGGNGDGSGIMGTVDVSVTVNCVTNQYDVNVTVTGLAAGNSVDIANGGDTLTISDSLVHTISTLDDGTGYAVSVTTNITTPYHVCNVTGGTGTLAGVDMSVTIYCVIPQYGINVTVAGLTVGHTIDVSNGGITTTLSDVITQTSFSIDDGTSYAVSTTNPTSPNQTCSVTGGSNGDGSGIMNTMDVSIGIYCNTPPVTTANTYTAFEDITLIANDADGGVAGMNDDSVLLNDSDVDGDTLSVINPGTFTATGLGGEITLTADGTFSYVPPADVSGQDILDFNVSDGIHTVASSLTIDVLPVNDAPTFTIMGNVISAELYPNIFNTTLNIAQFATNIDAGAPNENGQSLQFNASIFTDSVSVLIANGVSVSNTGNLTLTFTGNIGLAIIQLTLKDNGLTTNGGEDTSSMTEFVVSYSDVVFADSFDEAAMVKLFNYIDDIKSNSPLRGYPSYDMDNDTLVFRGHRLQLNGNRLNDEMMKVIKMWVDEIKKIEYLSGLSTQE